MSEETEKFQDMPSSLENEENWWYNSIYVRRRAKSAKEENGLSSPSRKREFTLHPLVLCGQNFRSLYTTRIPSLKNLVPISLRHVLRAHPEMRVVWFSE